MSAYALCTHSVQYTSTFDCLSQKRNEGSKSSKWDIKNQKHQTDGEREVNNQNISLKRHKEAAENKNRLEWVISFIVI